MGKKNRRKAAKAAAAAAGNVNSGWSSKHLILGPRPDGITCTNENPYACAVCSRAIPTTKFKDEGLSQINICCGTKACADCFSFERCAFCKTPWYQGALASYAKQRSKEGFAWAHRYFGMLHQAGVPPYVSKSACGAFCLYEKAADQDHPGACLQVVNCLIAGFGCKRNLEKARVAFEKAVRIPFQYDYQEVLSAGHSLSLALRGNAEVEKGHSVLLAMEMFAEKAGGQALGMVSLFYRRLEDFEGRRRCHRKASECPDACPFSALLGAVNIKNLCLVRMWYGVSSAVELGDDEVAESQKSLLKSTHEALCALRRKCAWCQNNLSRSNRKMCKGCKAHCYCSEACQKAHWHANEDCHGDECQKAMEVKKKTIAIMKK